MNDILRPPKFNARSSELCFDSTEVVKMLYYDVSDSLLIMGYFLLFVVGLFYIGANQCRWVGTCLMVELECLA